MMPTLYLAGPIHGCNDQEARAWRESVKGALTGRYNYRDPMDRDYRGREDANVTAIVEGDKADIGASDVVLVFSPHGASWGTPMEVLYAYEQGKRVIAVAREPVSPWLRYHAEIVATLGDAVVLLARDA